MLAARGESVAEAEAVAVAIFCLLVCLASLKVDQKKKRKEN